MLKSDTEIGPVYHRLPQRIRAHAVVCFMALILYRVMRMRLKANERVESPTRLLQQLQRIHQQTAWLATNLSQSPRRARTGAEAPMFAGFH